MLLRPGPRTTRRCRRWSWRWPGSRPARGSGPSPASHALADHEARARCSARKAARPAVPGRLAPSNWCCRSSMSRRHRRDHRGRTRSRASRLLTGRVRLPRPRPGRGPSRSRRRSTAGTSRASGRPVKISSRRPPRPGPRRGWVEAEAASDCDPSSHADDSATRVADSEVDQGHRWRGSGRSAGRRCRSSGSVVRSDASGSVGVPLRGLPTLIGLWSVRYWSGRARAA